MDHGFSLALMNRDGNICSAQSGLFDEINSGDLVGLAANVSCPKVTSYAFAQTQEGGSSILAIAPPDAAQSWESIPPELLRAAIDQQCYIVAGIDPRALSRRFSAFADAFGWSAAVTRTVEALYRHCDVKLAARLAGISFHTARQNLKVAREAIGAPNLPMLIMLLNVSSTQLRSAADESAGLLSEIFDLTERQLRIADIIANGDSRIQTAARLELSEALIKKELATIFDAVGVCNAIGLARFMSEARALSLFTNYVSNPEPFPAPHSHTIKVETGSRTIAASDYGPRTGKPVIVLHSSMTSRSTNRQLVEALQNAGFRPISLDRPGFGDTDNVTPGDIEHKGPFLCAAEDMETFCHEMDLAQVDIVTRGAAQVALAFHEHAPQLIRYAIVINPDPDTASSSKRDGRMGAIKHSFAKRPRAVASIARFIAVLSTYGRSRETMLKSIARSEPDKKVMADEANIVEYYRGIRTFHQGNIHGFINEQVALAKSGKPTPISGTRNFYLLIGESDFLHDAEETSAYWRDVLPDADIRIIPDAGRFLAYSHADYVVAALKTLTDTPHLGTPISESDANRQ